MMAGSLADRVTAGVRALKESLRQRQITLARQGIARTGQDPVVTTVDNREHAAIETVSFGGKIDMRFSPLKDAVLFTLAELRVRSPIDSGRYRAAHTVFVDGVQSDDLEHLRAGTVVMIANLAPYARLIELGESRFFAPDGVYQIVADIVAAVYHNLQVQFAWQDLRSAAGAESPTITLQDRR